MELLEHAAPANITSRGRGKAQLPPPGLTLTYICRSPLPTSSCAPTAHPARWQWRLWLCRSPWHCSRDSQCPQLRNMLVPRLVLPAKRVPVATATQSPWFRFGLSPLDVPAVF